MLNEMFSQAPSDWERTTLGEVCDRVQGVIQTGPFGSQLHASDYVSDANGIPSIMPVNIGDGIINTSEIKRVKEEDAVRLARHRVLPGDIVYSRRGDVERCALVREEERGWLCGTGCMLIRLQSQSVHARYLLYYLTQPCVKAWIVRHAVGATMPNLNTGIIRSIPLVLPPIDHQRKIASILGSLDDKIELNRRMNATLESMAQAIFKSWFIDFDPSKISSGQMPACRATHDPKVLGPFPSTIKDAELRPATTEDDPFDAFESPTVQMLMDAKVLNMGDGYRAKRVELSNEGLPFVRAGNLHDGGFQFENAEILGFDGVEKAGEKKSETFDVAFTSKGTVGRMTLVTAQTQQFVYSPQVCWWRVVDWNRLNPHVLYRWMKSDEFIRQVLLVKSQTDMAEYVSLRDQRAMRVNLPSAKFQNLIAPQLEQIDATLASNMAERQQLENLRDTLLPRLLSGNPNTLQTIDCDI